MDRADELIARMLVAMRREDALALAAMLDGMRCEDVMCTTRR